MNYTTGSNSLNPWFITGFSDAESSFILNINKQPKLTLGWSIKLVYSIHLHAKDADILYLLQRYFGFGNVSIYDDKVIYQVSRLSDLECIISHFDKYPLKSQKYADYLLFKQAFAIVKDKLHTTEVGLKKLLSIRASLNKGLSERLKKDFMDITSALRPEVPRISLNFNNVDDKFWVVGFVSGEGCFFVKTSKSKTHKLGVSVALAFLVSQNLRDYHLLEELQNFFGCGTLTITESSNIGTFNVRNTSYVLDKIIPFFEEYPVLGVKHKDFEDFKEASLLIKSKLHLTQEGLDKIILIKSRMNFKR